jgi:hypothetical protein
LTIREKVLGADHPDVTAVLSNLASRYTNLDRLLKPNHCISEPS